MSIRNLKSNKSIGTLSQWEEHVRSELNLVNSYLSIDEWKKEQSFAEILQEKLEVARTIKQKLMKLHGINDPKEVVGFRCQVCPAVFGWPTALGGHMSKAHPNHKKKTLRDEASGDKIRKSSIQRIKKEEMLHYEATRIHRDQSNEFTLGH